MKISSNVSLQTYNTFGIDVAADLFCHVASLDDFRLLMATDEYKLNKKLILGGGSNILFTDNFDGIVIRNQIPGITYQTLNDYEVLVKAGSGVVWHDFVKWCIEKNFAGIENLSLIPGMVGASPMQNIGAYGVEVKDVFYELEAIDMQTGDLKVMSASECGFRYRESVFKHALKGKFMIISVTFRLANLNNPKTVYQTKTDYGDIRNTLSEMNYDGLSIGEVSEAVVRIRTAKLPDPAVLGNAGSFFKNPSISFSAFETLKLKYPLIPGYPSVTNKDEVKVAAGWLIEQCGWKGKVIGHTGSHKNQALVLVNYGGANGKEIRELAKKIQQSVWDRFGIEILPEVNIY